MFTAFWARVTPTPSRILLASLLTWTFLPRITPDGSQYRKRIIRTPSARARATTASMLAVIPSRAPSAWPSLSL